MSKCSECGNKGWYYAERGSDKIAFCSCEAGRDPLEIVRKIQAKVQRLHGALHDISVICDGVRRV